MELYPWQWLHSSRNDQLLQAARTTTKAQGKSNEEEAGHEGKTGQVTDVANALGEKARRLVKVW